MQAAADINTPGIEMREIYPVILPTASNWTLLLFCELIFSNTGEHDFVMTKFDGTFEYQSLDHLGKFELDPRGFPLVFQPHTQTRKMARLLMQDHDFLTKYRIGTGWISDLLNGENPVLKLRVKVAGSLWAWARISNYTAEYLCNYPLEVTGQGLGMFDFSDWDAAKQRWTEAINRGADEGTQRLIRTELGGEVWVIMMVLISIAAVSFFFCCSINTCATCYTCQYPDQHGCKGQDAFSILNVVLFGPSKKVIRDWRASELLRVENTRGDASGSQVPTVAGLSEHPLGYHDGHLQSHGDGLPLEHLSPSPAYFGGAVPNKLDGPLPGTPPEHLPPGYFGDAVPNQLGRPMPGHSLAPAAGEAPGPAPAQMWPAMQRTYSGLGRIRVSIRDTPLPPFGRATARE